MQEETTISKPDERFVSAREFYSRLGIGKTTFYKKIRDGKLPKPIRLTERKVVWPLGQINLIMQRIITGELTL